MSKETSSDKTEENTESGELIAENGERRYGELWPIRAVDRDLAMAAIRDGMADDNKIERRLTASKLLMDIDGFRLKKDEFDDKTRRLDAGMPTEICDQGALGDACLGLADQLSNILGIGREATTKPIESVERSKGEAGLIEDRTSDSGAIPEATEGA